MPEDSVNEPDSHTEPQTIYFLDTNPPRKSEIWTQAELAEPEDLISTNAMEFGITFGLVALNVAIFVS